MEFASILMKMVVMSLVIVVGYISNKCGVMDADFNRRLTNLVLSVTTPALMLDAVINSENTFTLTQVGSVILISVLGYAVAIVVGYLVAWLMRTPKENLGVMRFMLMFGNVGFVGIPVAKAIFGSDGVFYASMFVIPFNLLAFTFGVFLVSGGGEHKLSWRDFCSPCVIAAVVALILAVVQISFPAVVCDTVELVGQVTTPASLLIIGSNLARLPLRNVVGGVRIWIMSIVRLLAGPVLIWLILRGWVTDSTILGTAVILQGMPVASACTMIALQYGGDADSAGQGTFMTTVLSILTIPLLTMLF